MLSVGLFTLEIQKDVISAHIRFDVLTDRLRDVTILNPLQECTSDYIYVTSFKTFCRYRKSSEFSFPQATIFVSDSPEKGLPQYDSSMGNVVFMRTSLYELHRQLQERLHTLSTIVGSCDPSAVHGLQELTSQLAYMAELNLSFFDQELRLLTVAGSKKTGEETNIMAARQLSRDQLKQLFPDFIERNVSAQTVVAENQVYGIMPLYLGTNCTGYLLSCGMQSAEYIQRFTELCGRLLLRFLSRGDSFTGTQAPLMEQIFHLLTTGAKADNTTIQRLLLQLRNPPKKCIRIMLIKFEKLPLSNRSEIVRQAEQIFPYDNVAWLNDMLFILLSSDKLFTEYAFQPHKIEILLKNYGGYAMLSNPVKKITSLPVAYLQCLYAIDVAWSIHRATETTRLMEFGDYVFFHVIDYFTQICRERYGSGNIVPFCHSGVVALIRYDRANSTNLCELLFYYLSNGQNIAKTSEHFYLHRNTVTYKKNLIVSLLNYDLSDANVNLQIIFSIMLIRYYDLYRNESIPFTIYDKKDF